MTTANRETAQVEIQKGHPMRDAWELYRATDAYANTRNWALKEAHVDGSLWAAFIAGYAAAPAAGAEHTHESGVVYCHACALEIFGAEALFAPESPSAAHAPGVGDGECPCCPVEIRNLAAVAHNAVVRWPHRFSAETIDELRRAVEMVNPLMDRHFADRAHSHPEGGKPRARAAEMEGRNSAVALGELTAALRKPGEA